MLTRIFRDDRKAVILIAGLVALAPTPSLADDWGDTSSATMSITVVIAPFGAVDAASREGAVGGWSVSGLNDGVMLSAPDVLTSASASDISVLSNADTPVSVRATDPRATLRLKQSSEFKGLSRTDFSLSLTKFTPTDGADRPLSVIIASL